MLPKRLRSTCMVLAAQAVLGAALLAAPATTFAYPIAERPLVLAHRGASGYLPEETMRAYRLAVQMGADVIEPDLFLTADGVLVARHDRSLNNTTNVVAVAATDPELAAKAVSGQYYVDLLTWADVQKVNARSRGTTGYATPGNGYYEADEVFKVASFREVLDYLHELYVTTGRVVGVYPEVKTIPSSVPGAADYHRAIADAMVAMLGDPKYGGLFDGSLHNVFLQSFDGSIVQYLAGTTGLPKVYLRSCPATAELAAEVAAYADGIGISAGSSASNAACVDRAHAAGLLVHVYTLTNNPAQYEVVYGWGVDGIFGNHPDVNASVRDALYPLAVEGFEPPVGSARSILRPAADGVPVPEAGTVWLPARSGSRVPLKFTVRDGNTGETLTTLMATVRVLQLFHLPACTGEGEEVPYPGLLGGPGVVRFDPADGHFVANLALPAVQSPACYRATVTLRDGSTLSTFIRAR